MFLRHVLILSNWSSKIQEPSSLSKVKKLQSWLLHSELHFINPMTPGSVVLLVLMMFSHQTVSSGITIFFSLNTFPCRLKEQCNNDKIKYNMTSMLMIQSVWKDWSLTGQLVSHEVILNHNHINVSNPIRMSLSNINKYEHEIIQEKGAKTHTVCINSESRILISKQSNLRERTNIFKFFSFLWTQQL